MKQASSLIVPFDCSKATLGSSLQDMNVLFSQPTKTSSGMAPSQAVRPQSRQDSRSFQLLCPASTFDPCTKIPMLEGLCEEGSMFLPCCRCGSSGQMRLQQITWICPGLWMCRELIS